VPERGRFTAQMDGTYDGPEGDERQVPSFYREFATGHHKPMVLSETSALYNNSRKAGASNQAIKSAWMDQVLTPSVVTRYPELKMINWFEQLKSEQEHYGVVDWRATADPQALQALKAHLASGRYLFAPAHYDPMCSRPSTVGVRSTQVDDP
jgi:hypothetical protein